jgi:hypothetical protein
MAMHAALPLDSSSARRSQCNIFPSMADSSKKGAIPPQIVVVLEGKGVKRAYGRERLQGMGYAVRRATSDQGSDRRPSALS